MKKWVTYLNVNKISPFTNINGKYYHNHPFVIFYSKEDNTVYFLQVRSYNEKHQKDIDTHKSVKIKSKENYEYINHDSIIDADTIYYMKQNDFEKVFKIDKNINYYELSNKNIQTVIKSLKNNIENKEVCIKEVSLNKNLTLNTDIIYMDKKYYIQKWRKWFNEDKNFVENFSDKDWEIFLKHEYKENYKPLTFIKHFKKSLIDNLELDIELGM